MYEENESHLNKITYLTFRLKELEKILMQRDKDHDKLQKLN
jgi:hypothetical protein